MSRFGIENREVRKLLWEEFEHAAAAVKLIWDEFPLKEAEKISYDEPAESGREDESVEVIDCDAESKDESAVEILASLAQKAFWSVVRTPRPRGAFEAPVRARKNFYECHHQ